MKDSRKLEIDGGLVLAMIGGGVLCIPVLGWLPLLGIAAACGTSIVIAERFNKRR